MKTSEGFNFVDGLQLLFIGLKIRGDIDWSWWLVMLPFSLVAVLAVHKAITKGD